MSKRGLFFLICLLLLLPAARTAAQDSLLAFRSLDSTGKMPDDTLKVNTLMAQSKKYYRFFDRRGLENPFLQEAIAISSRIKYHKGLAEAYNEMGTSKRNKSQYILATEYHEKALAAAEDSRDNRLIAVSHNNIGVDYRRRDMLQKAFDHHFRALKLAEKINDVRNITIATNSIGNINLSDGKYKDAIREFTRSLRLEK
jgi:tetratricopeptide (TPR) repeat protein